MIFISPQLSYINMILLSEAIFPHKMINYHLKTVANSRYSEINEKAFCCCNVTQHFQNQTDVLFTIIGWSGFLKCIQHIPPFKMCLSVDLYFIDGKTIILLEAVSGHYWVISIVSISALNFPWLLCKASSSQINTLPSSRWLRGNAALGLHSAQRAINSFCLKGPCWSDRTSANSARQPVLKHLILSGSAFHPQPLHLHK